MIGKLEWVGMNRHPGAVARRPADRRPSAPHARSVVAAALAQMGLLLCLAGCQLPWIGATPSPTATASAWQPLRRPLHLPTITPGAPCPVQTEHPVGPASDGWHALGDGPVYPVAPWDQGTYAIGDAGNNQGWYELKVAWVSRPEYPGLSLIRGGPIDGTGTLRFGLGGQELLTDLELPSGRRPPDGWGVWPSFTMPRAPGCYAYQVDGQSFSAVIVFRIVA
jgi:hypothetical protein